MKIVLAGVAGFAAGWFICKSQLEQKYLAMANEEAAAATEFYRSREQEKLQKAVDLAEASEETAEIREEFTEAATALANYQTGVLKTNTLLSKVEPIDETKPFIISDEEYMTAENGYEQYSLTYYQEDDVLLSQNDKVIEGKERAITVGDAMCFGERSNDPNIVYIRSHQLQMDFEVARSNGKYQEEVLGL